MVSNVVLKLSFADESYANFILAVSFGLSSFHMSSCCLLLQNGFWLSECVHLSTDSAYTASLDDGVILEGMGVDSSGGISIQAAPHKDSLISTGGSSIKKSSEEQKATGSNYVLDIQVTFLIRVD